ncbi:DUF1810 domain-containing protein [Spirosoma rhododendri]|uniref:DUF1810 domain-containing protein n=1 Tax=Spirosoma rhododendri TaxID=2728024 RepID=A0A7L5DV86_9BACT|nr:DUF1810 domain-containing protein [Spirosoma rhododendri]QJD79857.1 DUF1810 domain-containing protein [Spirosoma rhododendri]
MEITLIRFVDAQVNDYEQALAEIKSGRKRGHWMWYIFPQLRGLGFSEMAQFYGIRDLAEAKAYLAHPVLGPRLVAISRALISVNESSATQVMGSPDDMKLRSSMTLFSRADQDNPAAPDPVFQAVLDKFFGGKPDSKTLSMLTD